jgi:hypothetical protein
VCQGALIVSIYELLDKKQPTLGRSLRAGIRLFWPMLWLTVAVGLVATIAYEILRLLGGFTFVGSGVVFILLFIVFTLVLIAVSFIAKFTLFEIISHNRTFSEAWRLSAGLFRTHWLTCAEVALALFGLYVVATTLVHYVSVLALQLSILFLYTVPTSISLVKIISGLFFVGIELVLTAFYWVVWVMVFEVLNSPKMRLVSWIERRIGGAK